MLLVYSYCLGAHRQRWIPFRPPFWQRASNSSKTRWAPLANPCGWPHTHRIGAIHWINTVGGANGTPWWWCLWGELCCCLMDYLYYSCSNKSTGQEFFVPTRTLIRVNLLKLMSISNLNLIGVISLFICYWSPPTTMDAVSATIVAGGRARFQ